MPGIVISDTYDSLLTTTLKNYRKKLIDNIFNKFRLLNWLRKKGRVRYEDGGESIIEQLMYGKNTTFKAYSGYETLDTTPQEGLTVAKYTWREYGGTVAISRLEKRQNSGEHRILNLWQAKIKQAEASIRDKITTDLNANISASPAKAIDGVFLQVSNTPSTTTVGALSGATYTWWRNSQVSVGAYAANLETNMRTQYNTIAESDSEIGICASQTAFEYYEGLGITQKRFVDETATLDLGFEVLKYKGAEMFFDKAIATNVPVTGESMLMISAEHLSLVIDKESDFVTTDVVEPENQTAYVAKILAMLNLTCNNRRYHALLHGITAS